MRKKGSEGVPRYDGTPEQLGVSQEVLVWTSAVGADRGYECHEVLRLSSYEQTRPGSPNSNRCKQTRYKQLAQNHFELFIARTSNLLAMASITTTKAAANNVASQMDKHAAHVHAKRTR